VYETAVVTFIGSGGFAAAHGRHAYGEVMGNNGRIEQWVDPAPSMAENMAEPEGTGINPLHTHRGELAQQTDSPNLGHTVPPTSTWVPHLNFQQPAAKHGMFLGEVGNSPFAVSDDKADAMGIPHGSTIPWIKGIPDFGTHAVLGPNGSPGTYTVQGLNGNHDADRITIIRHLARENALTQRQIKAWLKKSRIRLYHSGGNNVQNVPKTIHDLHHSGSAQELREEN